jgi:hypothetical protein
VRTTNSGQRLTQRLRSYPCILEQPPGGGVLLFGECNKQVLSGDVGIVEFPGDLLGAIEDLVQRAVECRFGRGIPALLGKAGNLCFEPIRQVRHDDPDLGQDRLDNPLILAQQRREEMSIVDHRITAGDGNFECTAECLTSFYSQSFRSNHQFLLNTSVP